MTDQLPEAFATVVSVSTTSPFGSVTTTEMAALASDVPLNTGVASFSRRSEPVPVVSGPNVSTPMPVKATVVAVSTVNASVAGVPVLPALSVGVTRSV